METGDGRTGRTGGTEFSDVMGPAVMSESTAHKKKSRTKNSTAWEKRRDSVCVDEAQRRGRADALLSGNIRREGRTLRLCKLAMHLRIKPIDQNVGDGMLGIKVPNLGGG